MPFHPPHPDHVVKGDIFYWDGVALRRLAIGSTNQVLVVTSGAPAWVSLGADAISNRARFWEVVNFTLSAGAPAIAAQGANARYAAWAFDSASDEAVTTQTFRVPLDYVSGFAVNLHWTNLGAGAGNVVWSVACKVVNDAGDLNSTTGEATADDTISAPTQNVHKISTHSVSLSPAAGDHVRLSVARIGSSVSDTLGNDAGLLKVQLTYTADS